MIEEQQRHPQRWVQGVFGVNFWICLRGRWPHLYVKGSKVKGVCAHAGSDGPCYFGYLAIAIKRAPGAVAWRFAFSISDVPSYPLAKPLSG